MCTSTITRSRTAIVRVRSTVVAWSERCLRRLRYGRARMHHSTVASRPRVGSRRRDHRLLRTPRRHRSSRTSFVIADDVGIDQMQTFGYGGDDPPADADHRGVRAGRQARTWSMPGVLDESRGDLRGALSVPYQRARRARPRRSRELDGVAVRGRCRLLATRGTPSALFGKFHIGLQGNDPAWLRQHGARSRGLGFTCTFQGWLDTGDPSSIDTTAGGVAATGRWSMRSSRQRHAVGGADAGACWQPDGGVRELAPTGRFRRRRTGQIAGGVPFRTARAGPPPSSSTSRMMSPTLRVAAGLQLPRRPGRAGAADRSRSRRFPRQRGRERAVDWIHASRAGKPIG